MNQFFARGFRSSKRTTEIKAQVATELGLGEDVTVLVSELAWRSRNRRLLTAK